MDIDGAVEDIEIPVRDLIDEVLAGLHSLFRAGEALWEFILYRCKLKRNIAAAGAVDAVEPVVC